MHDRLSTTLKGCLGLLLLACLSTQSIARSFLIEGEGFRTTSTFSPIGVPGEAVSISVTLNTEDFYFRNSANPIFHYLDTLRTIPVTVVGEQSGAYPNVSPIDRLVALELTDSANSDDQIGLDVASTAGGTSLFTVYCRNDSCFDGDQGPFTPDGMFDLLKEAFFDTANWEIAGGLPGVFAGPDNSYTVFQDFEWALTDLDGPTLTSIEPTYDAGYVLSENPSLIDDETVLRVGGFQGSSTFPEMKPVLEFPLTGIPRTADILSATLQLDPYVSSGEPRIEVIGFAGDGEAAMRDATIDGPALAVTPPTSLSTYEDIELDTTYIESLLGGASHLGLRLQSLDSFDYLGFDASENTFSLSQPPTLLIEYVSDELPGDHNADGVVDAADYTLWRDGEARVGGAEGYQVWAENYGLNQSAASSSSTQPQGVPEALPIVSLLVACASTLSFRRPVDLAA